MCLNGNRFQADISWRDQVGNSGSGNVYPVGEDYWGIFWFFTRMNGEILVKVLDGCEYNDHYWVFASGATDVEYTLTVTDTTTGDTQIYSNDLGMPAEAVLDVSAFATCP